MNKITVQNEKKLDDEKAFTDGAEALRLEWDRAPHNAKGAASGQGGALSETETGAGWYLVGLMLRC